MSHALQSIMQAYFPEEQPTIEPVPFGLTNTTWFVKVNGHTYVARHYDRYTKSLPSLDLEIEVTLFLLQSNLSFRIPSFLPTKDGDLYVTLSDGSLGAVVSFIEGTAPLIQIQADALAFGRVVGELSARLGEYERQESMAYAGTPFTDLYHLHPLATPKEIAAFWEQPPFPLTDQQKQTYNEVLTDVMAQLDTLLSLPRQLVHHDVLVFNLLSVERRITGVLDFDFLALDISSLEFAISLNHVLQISGGSLEMATAFINGYAAFRSCSTEELSHLRSLTRLYHIAVLHIYIGQYRAGKENATAFAYIANQLIERDRWLAEHEDQLTILLSPLHSRPL